MFALDLAHWVDRIFSARIDYSYGSLNTFVLSLLFLYYCSVAAHFVISCQSKQFSEGNHHISWNELYLNKSTNFGKTVSKNHTS